MARLKGSLDYGFNFNIGASGPVDSRMLVEYISDLTSANTWPSASAPVYDGMQVVGKENSSIYILTDKTNYTNLSAWKKVGSDGGGGSIGDVDGSTVKVSNKYVNVTYPNNNVSTDTFQAINDGDTLDNSINKLEDNVVVLIKNINTLKSSMGDVTDENGNIISISEYSDNQLDGGTY